MERLTEKLPDGRNIIRCHHDEIFNPKYGHFIAGEAVDKLAEYEDAEEQGLLLRLPCRVGSTLYQPIYQSINEYKVIGLCFDIHHNKWMYEVAYEVGFEWHKTVCDFNYIGKTVFLTKEEAEAALAEMRSTEATHMSR